MKIKLIFNYEFAILNCILIILKLQYIFADFETCNSTVNISNWTIIGCSQTYANDPSLGNVENSNIELRRFLGIPYAEPPVGDLRFKVTKPKSYSTITTYNANNFGNICFQPPLDSLINYIKPQSEDCLFLNVWTNTLNTNANKPVMVFIHGGAFQFGAGDPYDGSKLALRDVVVVTLNYRLGAFGFFCTKDPESPGNQGLYDQIEAIKWVKNNIQLFGGNASQITLFGESAGAMSVSLLMASEISKDLFIRGILQSGSGLTNQYIKNIDYTDSVAHRFASNSTIWLSASKPGNCIGTDWIKCLRDKSAVDIFQAQMSALIFDWNPTHIWYSASLFVFVPCYGDKLIPNPLKKSIELGDFGHNIDVLLGHNEMEAAYFAQLYDTFSALFVFPNILGGRYQPDLPLPNITNCADKPVIIIPTVSVQEISRDISKCFIDNQTINQPIVSAYIQTFSDGNVFSTTPVLYNSNTERYLIRASATHALGDYGLTCPTVLLGDHLLKSSYFTGKVYQYKLTYANSKSPCYTSCWCKATHLDDLPLVFGFPFITTGYNNIDKQISIQMMNIWTDFAKSGNLSLTINKVWPPYSVGSNGETNLKYFELNPDPLRFGRVFENSYNGNEYRPPVVMNCKGFWAPIIDGQF